MCDSEKGGDTVTALTVLYGENGPKHILALNQWNKSDLQAAAEWLRKLLRYIGKELRSLPMLSKGDYEADSIQERSQVGRVSDTPRWAFAGCLELYKCKNGIH